MNAGRRVLVARLDSFGDVLVAGPAVRAVAAGAAHVTMLCGPQGAPAADLLPGIDWVRVWAAPWVTETARPIDDALLAEFRALIAEEQPDEAVVLTSFHQSPLPLALLLRLAGVPRVSGASVDHPGSLLDVRLRPGEDLPEDLPEPERALRIAEAAGFRLPPDDDGRLAVRHDAVPPPPVAGLDRYVVVHPGASVPARSWPESHHRALVAAYAERGVPVVVTGSPGERALTAAVAGDTGIDLGGRTSPAELAAVLAGAEVVVVGNTGPAHLAAAVGAPIVSLFSPVVPAAKWAPYAPLVELLGDQAAPCRLSRARECPVSGHPCLSGVRIADVLEAHERLLTRVSRTDRRSLRGGPEGAA
ncbi:glycosyltransferase family 9 protein [Curtobacterium flaccumfaciens pv. flaccumfaciens]|uniref:glycosyltransferase family 9 protein n=1 Tax=Curtobacterium flaccumfaciens TaxID=2035 RepID=UPI001ADBBFC5|nr:glycosyltransferase family 9 protein [Curtobacterium flaccumfaciens]MBO9048655.1 glycosyltransferase family 9 protein [Curtobacterium flaccumfaciens pv. flaccumfaciens]MBO9056452.1 glycosyltransferase family 9 protein [Curtobacterium flaccumfaciens pv. flaccumfaciens]QTR89243.1 glycosyltransferase family 9 protein [Curtobacterium flaccumfaciens pv. flaccumfaciens]QVG67777.1 glycosyltransferase family 9 protein [Curtobacterium flaccumfaciens pv. flaccumfaciens]